jgi:hypothetical protein
MDSTPDAYYSQIRVPDRRPKQALQAATPDRRSTDEARQGKIDLTRHGRQIGNLAKSQQLKLTTLAECHRGTQLPRGPVAKRSAIRHSTRGRRRGAARNCAIPPVTEPMAFPKESDWTNAPITAPNSTERTRDKGIRLGVGSTCLRPPTFGARCLVRTLHRQSGWQTHGPETQRPYLEGCVRTGDAWRVQ